MSTHSGDARSEAERSAKRAADEAAAAQAKAIEDAAAATGAADEAKITEISSRTGQPLGNVPTN